MSQVQPKTPIMAFRSEEAAARYYAAYDAVLKQWPVPFDELYIPTTFGDTHVIASGPKGAPPVVLLHPAGGGAVIWIRNVGPLSDAFRTYAVDTVSEPNKSGLTRTIGMRTQRGDFACWMEELLDGLHIDKTHLVGNSFGGFLAVNTALAIPERVNKVVLISPAATFVSVPAWGWHFIPANTIGLLVGSDDMLLKPYAWIWQDFPMEECISELRATTAVTGRPRHWSPTVFRDDELRGVRVPILLLIGDHEVIYRPERAIERATRLVPGLRAEIIPNANHIAEYTACEAVNQRIVEFLSE